MVKVTVQTHGFKELEAVLVNDLPKTTAKNVLKRAAIEAMKRIEARAQELAPKDDGTLADSITTKPVKAQRTSRTRYASQSGVTVATGPTGRPEGGNAAWQEFGTVNMPANPFMRPAADSESGAVIDDVRAALVAQIDKAKARIARKLAKGK
jgi:HK97 gp10 family phage protein